MIPRLSRTSAVMSCLSMFGRREKVIRRREAKLEFAGRDGDDIGSAALFSSLPHVVDASAFVPTITTTLSNNRFVRHCRNDIFDTSINARPRKSSPSSTMDVSTITTPQTTTASTTTTTTTTTPTIQLPSWTHHSEEDVIAVIIDAENVRGRTGFELDHADLLDRLLVWTSMRYGYAYGKTIVVIDHGSQASAIVLRGDTSFQEVDGGNKDTTTWSNTNLCVSFAGPQCKADDIIARDVKWLLSSKYNPQSLSNNRRRKVVIVITADQELIYRCRNAAAATTASITSSDGDSDVVYKTRKKTSRAERMRQFKMPATSNLDIDTTNDDVLHENVSIRADDMAVVFPPTVEVISPQRFLEDLDLAVQEWLQQHEQQHHNDSSIDSDVKKKDDDGIFTTMSTSTLWKFRRV